MQIVKARTAFGTCTLGSPFGFGHENTPLVLVKGDGAPLSMFLMPMRVQAPWIATLGRFCQKLVRQIEKSGPNVNKKSEFG
ncbi:hypothetical protein JCM17846_30510 [Iodidimonas nitroreducens]|uniref:Uncharacterized protein n=1 Tax=Iodidimonas nitroreducens TaxID=1236968 RepID=A0A5A7NE81_9PROT|nr:hypothetical protein JCM17846_30510 [Iodidimonas nitroreducens]